MIVLIIIEILIVVFNSVGVGWALRGIIDNKYFNNDSENK